MQPDPRFLQQPKYFWANIRTLSQHIGYTVRLKKKKGDKAKATGPIRVPTVDEIALALQELGLSSDHLIGKDQKLTEVGKRVHAYFEYRAKAINDVVRPLLMDKDQARELFESTKAKLCPKCPIPMNKQKGAKKAPAYLTGLVNMLVEANIGYLPCDYDPRELTTVTLNDVPLRTLARRVDGAFPKPVNPIAVWEVKEYYYTTTFGSRVADGVYETLLDGMELEELREEEKIDVKHYLMVDDRYTWWECGRSYLCRMIDMLNMGYVDEVLFGKEIVDRLPVLAKEWVTLYHNRQKAKV